MINKGKQQTYKLHYIEMKRESAFPKTPAHPVSEKKTPFTPRSQSTPQLENWRGFTTSQTWHSMQTILAPRNSHKRMVYFFPLLSCTQFSCPFVTIIFTPPPHWHCVFFLRVFQCVKIKIINGRNQVEDDQHFVGCTSAGNADQTVAGGWILSSRCGAA